MKTLRLDTSALIQWFSHSKRDFPWRNSPSPYKVWISEVMLQQTRAAAVVPYFLKWIEHFPNPQALARASEIEVIKLWEGLGYYSRARNLHKGAKQICDSFGGALPSDPVQLQSIHGLGPYTVGAILSFAFGKKHPAVDGNVLRVLTRHFAIEQEISSASTRKGVEKIAHSLIPDDQPAAFNEAMIELGAIVCTPKKPRCLICPLRKTCKAHSLKKTDKIPVKKKRQKTILLKRTVFIIQHQNSILIKKTPKGQVMEGLYEFPYVERGQSFSLNSNLEKIREFPTISHTFTKYKATLYPSLFTSKTKLCLQNHTWVPQKDLPSLPFSSGHRKILSLICN